MRNTIGIDFGSTNCRLAELDASGRLGLVMTRDQGESIPVIIVVTPAGEILTGRAATASVGAQGNDVIIALLDRLGTDPQTALAICCRTPAELLSVFLQRLRNDAETRIGGAVDQVTIAVSPNTAPSVRELIVSSALEVGVSASIIDSAVAAAWGSARLNSSQTPTRVLVYDLGQTRFSVAAVGFDGKKLITLKHSDVQGVGGDAFDGRIVEYMAALARSKQNGDPLADVRATLELRRIAHEARVVLSDQQSTDLIWQSKDIDLTLDRAAFEEMIAASVHATFEACEDLLDQVGWKASQLDLVVPVGATTWTPLVRRVLADKFGAAVCESEPTRVVAFGAALLGRETQVSVRAADSAEAIAFATPDENPPSPVEPIGEQMIHNDESEVDQTPEPDPAPVPVETGTPSEPTPHEVARRCARIRIDGSVFHMAVESSFSETVLGSTRVYLGQEVQGSISCRILLDDAANAFEASLEIPDGVISHSAAELVFEIDRATGVPHVLATFQTAGGLREVRMNCVVAAPSPQPSEPTAVPEAAILAPTGPVYPRIEPCDTGSNYKSFLTREPATGHAALLTVYAATEDRGQSAFLNSLLPLTVSHPNVVRVIDFGRMENDLFLVTDYPQGGSLRSLMGKGRQRQIVSPQSAVPLVAQVCHGLGALHRAHIFHRNLKPGNVWLDGERTHAKIADFQVAVLLRSGSSMPQISGTLPYMAPEVLEGKADHRADIYALGVTLYELLTGRLPIWASDQAQMVDQIVNREPPDPRSLNHQIPERLNQIMVRAIAKDPALRFQTAEEMGEALFAETGGSTI